MSLVRFWKESVPLTVKLQDNDITPDFRKLLALEDFLFILDVQGHIWKGYIDSSTYFNLEKTHLKGIDIAVTSKHLYYVTEAGRVFKTLPSLENSEEIILYEGASNCVHGYATSSRRISVKNISAGGMGVLFISDKGELWASGSHPQLGIETDFEAKKSSFFEGRHVTHISSGEDFNVILCHKKDDNCSVNLPKKGDSEVFLSNCPDCANENALSPLSPQSYSDQFKKSSESLSASSSTSKNNDETDNKCNNSSSSGSEDSPHISDMTECHLSQSIEEEVHLNTEKCDKVSSMILINTEAARQFLTRQLSWVSTGGEELLAEVSGPTRILRQNVTTVASLVYEGVKTVGDKVATLSRHVSGGSDNNSDSFEEFEELNQSNPSLNNSLRWEMSCSEGSEEGGLEKMFESRTKGSRLIRGEVWTWGNNSRLGSQQLQQHGGTSDSIKRNKPILVGCVSHVGVREVHCGRFHCLIQLLDGRVYTWGSDNSRGQLLGSSTIAGGGGGPTLVGRGAVSLAAGSTSSFLLDRSRALTTNLSISLENIGGLTPRYLLASGAVSCLVFSRSLDSEESSSGAGGGGGSRDDSTCRLDLAHEQCYLEELLVVWTNLVRPLSRKSSLDEALSNLASCYTDLIHLTAVIVDSLLSGRVSYVVLAQYQDEIIYIYESYLSLVCDVMATNGFCHIPRNVECSSLTAYFSDRLPTGKTSPEAVVTCAFIQPLSHLPVYKGMVSRGGSGDCLPKWEALLELSELKKREAETTKLFWDSAGRLAETLRLPSRRIVRESRSSPLAVQGASRFSSHWFILLSDVFVHVTGGSQTLHNLQTVWVELLNDSDNNQNLLVITTPEESLTLTTANHLEKTEWFHAFQTTIRKLLNKPVVPLARSASYTFTKHPLYKDAKYTGRWLSGKMHGAGKLEWSCGKVYSGQFHNNLCHGFGRLEIPGVSVFEGQWKDGAQNGYGITRYDSGDVYNGHYKDGLENGHGVKKTGRFTSSQASVYVGEWLLGLRHGYGVLNSIGTGEKYMGCWSGNMKNGSGLIVTLDGIYYEGTFCQDVLTGHGVMVFEDGSHYEGELKEPGVFGGRGTLTFPTGDYFEGVLHGTWAGGIKISGTLHKSMSPLASPQQSFHKPKSYGEFCVAADLKWKAVFRQCWSLLGFSTEGKGVDTGRAWENVAITLGSRHLSRHHELLQTTPQFGRTSLDSKSYQQVSEYLNQAFESGLHPLGRALAELVEAYNTTYSGVVHPLLLSQAVAELHSLTHRLYQIVRLLFPALPQPSSHLELSELPGGVVSMTGLLHPIILPRLYSSLLVLYSLHNKTEDGTYWKRLLKWNRQPNTTLMAFLGIDQKFWKEEIFSNAVETLQLLKTTFSPMEKLIVIQNTFQEITKAAQSELGDGFIWTMDDLFPVFQYVVVRAHIQGLGSELHYIEDFMEPTVKTGELGIMFTTLKACFFQILQEKVNIMT